MSKFVCPVCITKLQIIDRKIDTMMMDFNYLYTEYTCGRCNYSVDFVANKENIREQIMAAAFRSACKILVSIGQGERIDLSVIERLRAFVASPEFAAYKKIWEDNSVDFWVQNKHLIDFI